MFEYTDVMCEVCNSFIANIPSNLSEEDLIHSVHEENPNAFYYDNNGCGLLFWCNRECVDEMSECTCSSGGYCEFEVSNSATIVW